ncbi:PIG-L deacetylase family protein [Lentzea sp. NPDC004782]|uniref:PIG-L deacetylase family protein n=1 Tax=Lentzea sp. NPDC004782 TaxID=3154458 RepID=UPI0033B08E3E
MQFAGPRTLLAVHAHPGDESCATGGVLAHYAGQGVRVVVVTCTSGELGNAPGGARPGELGHHPELVAAHRRAELVAACDVLGVTDLELLGYHDSGVTGEVPPGAFCAVPVETAAGRVAALIEHYQPQVVVTYEDRHRDRTHVGRVARLAVRSTGIPAKLYLRGHGRTVVDTAAVAQLKREAVRCHGSQSFADDEPESYIRAFDLSGSPLPETDFFAGVTSCAPDLPRW